MLVAQMKGLLVPETATDVGLIELVRNVIGIRGPDKTIVIRYGVEPGMPLVRIQCDADVKFYIQLKKKDVHVLSKFSITIDVLDESAVEAMPPEVGESNHIDVQPSREGGQSDEAMQHVNDSNLIILPPRPPHIPSPTVGLDLHTEYGIEKQHHDLCTAHDDCNAGELNVADDARHSNEKSITASIGAHSIANNTRSQSVNVPSSDSVSSSVIVADYIPVIMRKNYIFKNEKLLQYHLHHDAMILPAWAEMVKRKNPAFDIHIETDSKNCLKYFYMCLATSKHGWPYCRPVIVVDGSALQARFGGMLLAACGHNVNGSIFPLAFANLVYPDAAFGICIQHLAANLKTSRGQLISLSTPSPTVLRKYGLSIRVKGTVPADDFRSIKFLALMQWPSVTTDELIHTIIALITIRKIISMHAMHM
ncbi:hypothetical protein TIFTF001_039136 [Ficus carica]|uniref:MULE transposase domain-containing protein n=1 Tax=Ficus carica TaxID=3494 RepID=A0AA88EA78_FICCA|nr:hypothetical protein TIFTF001_039136 [Ficus carica]